jgi:DNA-binding CsgD family transcriptional regulator
MILSAIELAQGAGSALEFERAALEALNASIGFDCAFFFTNDAVPTATGLPPAFATAVTTPTAEKYEREMLPVKAAALANRGVAIDSDVLGESRRRCAYFREFAEPVSGRHSLLAYLRLRGDIVASVMLGRCRGSFHTHEVDAVQELLPSLAVARASFGLPRSRALDALSPRERELMNYLCLGYTNREIAMACGTSANTVRNQLASAFHKLGASTRAEAVGIARG